MSESTPDDKMVILSGTEPISRAMFDAMLVALVPDTRHVAGSHEDRDDRKLREFGYSYGGSPSRMKTKPTNPERDAWNAAVDAKKADKKAKKGTK